MLVKVRNAKLIFQTTWTQKICKPNILSSAHMEVLLWFWTLHQTREPWSSSPCWMMPCSRSFRPNCSASSLEGISPSCRSQSTNSEATSVRSNDTPSSSRVWIRLFSVFINLWGRNKKETAQENMQTCTIMLLVLYSFHCSCFVFYICFENVKKICIKRLQKQRKHIRRHEKHVEEDQTWSACWSFQGHGLNLMSITYKL